MMNSKQSLNYCVNEMVPLGTSREAVIHEITSKGEQPPADLDLVKFSAKPTRKTTVLLAIFVIAVVVFAVFVGIFVSNHFKNKEKEGSKRK